MPPYKKVKRFLFSAKHWQMIKGYLGSNDTRKLQIGSERNVLKGWLNTDIRPRNGAVFLDARSRFPFNNSTFDYIFSEHLIEHLGYKEGLEFLKECYRILKPGGKMRVATPDLRFFVELYNPAKTEAQGKYISWITDTFLKDLSEKKDVFVINNIFTNWGHKFIYDFQTLRDEMVKAGFVNITQCEVGESGDENLKGIESHFKDEFAEYSKMETFVVEGTKP